MKTIKKYKPKIDENLHHREKVIKRRREIELQKLDSEQAFIDYWNSDAPYKLKLQGEFAKRKALKAKYKKYLWRVLFFFLALVLLASLIM